MSYAVERTLVLLKPDAIQRGFVGEIISRIEKKGYTITGMKLLRLSREKAEELYSVHRAKSFFQDLVDFVTTSPVVAVVVEGPAAITMMRKLIGSTDPLEADAGTIRGDLGVSGTKNLIHASDSPEMAAREIELFFQEKELHSYSKPTEAHYLT